MAGFLLQQQLLQQKRENRFIASTSTVQIPPNCKICVHVSSYCFGHGIYGHNSGVK
jgi:hypothetical protein